MWYFLTFLFGMRCDIKEDGGSMEIRNSNRRNRKHRNRSFDSSLIEDSVTMKNFFRPPIKFGKRKSHLKSKLAAKKKGRRR